MNAALAIADQVAAEGGVRPRLVPEELTELYRRNDLRSVVYVAAVALSLVVTIAVAASAPHWGVLAVAIVLIGALQHHCSLIHHEAVHYLLFRSRALNEAVGSIVASAIGFSMAYRTHHLAHHRRLGHDDDPDLDAYGHYPATPFWFVADILWHLSCGAGIQQFFRQVRRSRALPPAAGGTSKWQMLGIAATQLLLLALFAAAGHPLLYFVLWLLPLLAVAKTLAHFRGVAEHTLTRCDEGSSTRFRTILCGPIERFLFAPMNFNYHAEHHFYPAIPYYHLPRAFALLREDPAYRASVQVERGYLGFLWRQAVRRA